MASNLNVRACVMLAMLGYPALPAWAGRGIQIENLGTVTPCFLGATSCDFVDISQSGVYQRAYVYREGIVSINALLPATANAADPASLGTGVWFAPGLSAGASYEVSYYISPVLTSPFNGRSAGWGFNFAQVGPFPQANPVDFQVFLSSGAGRAFDPNTETSAWNGVKAELGYLGFPNFRGTPGLPAPGALIGISWGPGYQQTVRFENGLLVGPAPTDTDFVSTAGIRTANGVSAPTQFTPLYATGGVPEPATWTIMVLGFALAGTAMRRRRARPALA